jgi:hypothetical protein
MSVSRTRIVRLTRAKSLTGVTLFFTYEGGAGRGNSRSSFIQPEHVPPFEGDSGWFEIERVHARPWGFDRVVRQVDPPKAR